MKEIDLNQMQLLFGGREETDAIGCTGVILMGAVLSVATLGWGLFVMGMGVGICASESRQ